MIEDHPLNAKVLVRFKRRADGGLRALCDEVPGFYLSSIDKRAVMADVVPALEMLLCVNHGIDVDASPLGYGLYQLTERRVDPVVVEDELGAEEYVQEYLLLKKKAA